MLQLSDRNTASRMEIQKTTVQEVAHALTYLKINTFKTAPFFWLSTNIRKSPMNCFYRECSALCSSKSSTEKTWGECEHPSRSFYRWQNGLPAFIQQIGEIIATNVFYRYCQGRAMTCAWISIGLGHRQII